MSQENLSQQQQQQQPQHHHQQPQSQQQLTTQQQIYQNNLVTINSSLPLNTGWLNNYEIFDLNRFNLNMKYK
jgi:hypothetical protein